MTLDFKNSYSGGQIATSIEMKGADTMIKMLENLAKDGKQAVKDGVVEVQEVIMANSFPRVPKKEGGLEGSAFSNDPVEEGNTIRTEFGYNIAYAVPQHEELEWVHPIKGEAKYLENPINEIAPEVDGIMRSHVEPVIKKAAAEASR